VSQRRQVQRRGHAAFRARLQELARTQLEAEVGRLNVRAAVLGDGLRQRAQHTAFTQQQRVTQRRRAARGRDGTEARLVGASRQPLTSTHIGGFFTKLMGDM
jgi:hypothetical protein